MIAVTGANGLLGSFIIRELIRHHEPFVALKRKGSDTSLLDDVSSQITWRDADVLDPVGLNEAFAGVSTIIHTAAIVSFNPRRANDILNINVTGTRNVVNTALAQGVKRLLHISSVAALGRQKQQQVIDETNAWVDNAMNTVYAESKYLAELEVFRGQEEGLSTVILNPSVILAPADWDKSSAKLFKYVWNETPFYTDAYMNYVDVRDVVNIIYKLLHTKHEGQRFIVNAGNISFKNFFDSVAIQFNRKSPSVKVGSALLKLAAHAFAVKSWFTGEDPLITKETARLSGTAFLYDNKKIKNVLKMEFQPFDTTIQWCCHSYMTKLSVKKTRERS